MRKPNPSAWFKPLYHRCWGVEEGYKREKYRLEIENFSGLTAQAIQQDFYAKILVMNLIAILSLGRSSDRGSSVPRPPACLPVGFANALSKMKDNLIRLFVFEASS